jgi:hypothetical protein
MTESRQNEPDLFELKMRPHPSPQSSVAVIEVHCHVGGPWALAFAKVMLTDMQLKDSGALHLLSVRKDLRQMIELD